MRSPNKVFFIDIALTSGLIDLWQISKNLQEDEIKLIQVSNNTLLSRFKSLFV